MFSSCTSINSFCNFIFCEKLDLSLLKLKIKLKFLHPHHLHHRNYFKFYNFEVIYESNKYLSNYKIQKPTLYYEFINYLWIRKCLLNCRISNSILYSKFYNLKVIFRIIKFRSQLYIMNFTIWKSFGNPKNDFQIVEFERKFFIPNFKI